MARRLGSPTENKDSTTALSIRKSVALIGNKDKFTCNGLIQQMTLKTENLLSKLKRQF